MGLCAIQGACCDVCASNTYWSLWVVVSCCLLLLLAVCIYGNSLNSLFQVRQLQQTLLLLHVFTRSHVHTLILPCLFTLKAHKSDRTNVRKCACATVHNFWQINDTEQAITSRIRIQNKNFGLELTKESFESLVKLSNKQHQGL